MEAVIELLRSAKGEIIGGLVVAIILGLYGYCRSLVRMCIRKKQELERLKAELAGLNATKGEFERLQEALKESESQREDLQQGLKLIREEVKRKDEALKESESKRKDVGTRLEQANAKLLRKDELLNRLREQYPIISDDDFLKLCKSACVEDVEKAILDGANVNARDNSRDNNGRTALLLAVRQSNTEILELLLNYGAEVNAEDNEGETALMLAAIRGDTAIAEILLIHGAEVNARDNYGRTALLSADMKCLDVIELLLKYGADINAKDNDSSTALMKGAVFGFTEFADLLLRHGAEVNIRDNDGDTALTLAAGYGKDKIVELLLRFVRMSTLRTITAQQL